MFLQAIDSLRNEADLSRVIEQLSSGNIEAALAALHINSAAFAPYRDKIAQVFSLGGKAGVDSMPEIRDAEGVKVVIRFDGRNPRAEKVLREHSSKAIQEIVEDQRIMARDVLEQSLIKGINPRTTALDIVGRVNRKTGKREGGFLGLTDHQKSYVTRAEAELTGSTTEMRNYLTRKARTKRYDRHVKKSLKDGTPIPAEIREKMVKGYKNKLLKLRGDTIGRTETLSSLHQGRNEAFNQAIDTGAVQKSEVRRTWETAHDNRVRESHVTMDGQEVGMDEPYITGDGIEIMYPVDPNAPASEIINCRCTEDIRIDFLSRLKN